MVKVSEINGKKVITTDAFNVGKVSGAEMDDQWRITHVYVDLTKDAANELGFKKPVLGHITILPASQANPRTWRLSNTKQNQRRTQRNPRMQGQLVQV